LAQRTEAGEEDEEEERVSYTIIRINERDGRIARIENDAVWVEFDKGSAGNFPISDFAPSEREFVVVGTRVTYERGMRDSPGGQRERWSRIYVKGE
jgi:hypothetical protein